MKKVMVSVVVITYNHEKFIEQAIDSIIMQKTDFDYEVIIGNDCSTDNTAAILEKYKKYDNFKIYNNKQNKGATKNLCDIIQKCKGKYIAFLEGDDYWTDKNKLQLQVDFLEKNSKYSGVSHRQNIVDVNNNYVMTFENWTKRHSKKYKFSDVEKGKIYFQLNSLLVRNYFRNNDYSCIYKLDPLVGDRTLLAYITSFSDIYILNENMSVYRHFEKSERKVTVFNSTLHSLKFYSKFENICLPNNKKCNFKKYKNEIVSDYYLMSFIKREKISKNEKELINSYASMPIFLIIISCVIERIFRYISNFFYNLIK